MSLAGGGGESKSNRESSSSQRWNYTYNDNGQITKISNGIDTWFKMFKDDGTKYWQNERTRKVRVLLPI